MKSSTSPRRLNEQLSDLIAAPIGDREDAPVLGQTFQLRILRWLVLNADDDSRSAPIPSRSPVRRLFLAGMMNSLQSANAPAELPMMTLSCRRSRCIEPVSRK